MNTSAFSESLDRFSKFFISPLFDETYAEKELKAIDSEYSMRFENEAWRSHHLMNILSDPSHPLFRSFMGNSDSLRGIPRQALVNFFNQYYSANLMKLAIVSPLELDELEAMVRRYFTAIINRNVRLPDISSKVISPSLLPRIVQMKTIGASISSPYEMELQFSLPSLKETIYSTPQTLIANLISYNGQGSFAQSLQEAGLANSVVAVPTPDSYRSELRVTFELTEKGMLNAAEIQSQFFAYIRQLYSAGLTSEYFSDFQKIAELRYIYSTPEAGIEAASDFARDLRYWPGAEIEALNQLQIRYSPESFRAALREITPEKVQIFLKGKNVITDRHENYFNIDYSVKKLDSNSLRAGVHRWKKLRFALPKANSWLPSDLSFEGQTQAAPIEIRLDDKSHLYIQEDHEFHKPHGKILLEVLLPQEKDAKSKVIRSLYVKTILQGLDTWQEETSEAGLTVSLKSNGMGLLFEFSGFAEKLPAFAKEFISRMSQLALSKSAFKNVQVQAMKAFLVQEADPDLMGEFAQLMDPSSSTYLELAEAMGKLTLDEVNTEFEHIFSKIFLRGFGFGHLNRRALESTADHFLSTFHSVGLPREEFPIFESTRLPKGQSYLKMSRVSDQDNSWLLSYQFGKATHPRIVSLMLANSYLDTAFYQKMRTEESLGYIAQVVPAVSLATCGLDFIIESNQSLSKVRRLAENWISAKTKEMVSISDSEFENLRGGLVESLDQKAKTFAEKYEELKEGFLHKHGDWNWKKSQIDVLKSIPKVEVIRRWDKAFNDVTSRKVTIVQFGQSTKAKRPFVKARKNEKIVWKLSKFKKQTRIPYQYAVE